jgi:hypothetical protein
MAALHLSLEVCRVGRLMFRKSMLNLARNSVSIFVKHLHSTFSAKFVNFLIQCCSAYFQNQIFKDFDILDKKLLYFAQ